MLELSVEAAPEIVGDVAARVMALWPYLEVETVENLVTLHFSVGESLDEDLRLFEETLQAVEKSRGLDELGVRERNLSGPDSGPPVQAIGRFVIRRPEAAVKAEPDRLVLTLDAGHAFGTGGHPTTALSLIALDEFFNPPPGAPSRQGSRVLDVGTGSGVLSLAAAKLGAGRILAVDPAPEAVEAARKNAELNGVRLEIEPVGADRVKGEYDLVLANLVPAVMMRTGKKLAKLLAADGVMIVSGFPDSQTPLVVKALTRAGLTARKSYSRAGWGGLSLFKTPERDLAPVDEFIRRGDLSDPQDIGDPAEADIED